MAEERIAEPPSYLAGLSLAGRAVVIIGGGSSVNRRVHRFLRAGALVTIVSPQVLVAIEALAAAGQVSWVCRTYEAGDLSGAWYAMAATDRPEVNAAVVAEADERRIFCVRADLGAAGSAVTPAVGGHDGLRLAVLAGGDHRRSGAVRDALVDVMRRGLAAPGRAEGVAIVGGGPGDPELITVRGARLLAMADVVVVDRLAPGELLEGVRRDAVIIDAAKLPRGRSMAQETINATLIEHARAGRFVVRLKGGDPYVFGRGYEELQALTAAGVPTTVVPGVTSAFAAPALAGIPATHRGVTHEAVVVSGHVAPGHPDSLVDWSALGRLTGTIVVLMGLANAAVSVVFAASSPGQRRVDTELSTLGADLPAEPGVPAVIVIGEVTRLAPGRGGDGGPSQA